MTVALLGIAVLATAGGAGMASNAGALTADQSSGSGVPQAASDAGNTTLRVALPETPTGLAGFQLTLELEAGTVTNASYPEAFQPTTEPAIGAEGRTVTLEAADVSDAITADDGDVTLATVTATELDGNQPSVQVTDATIDADGGDRIEPAAVTVTVQDESGGDVRAGSAEGQEAQNGTASGSGTASGGEETAGADGAGFGVLAAVGALLGLGTLARRR